MSVDPNAAGGGGLSANQIYNIGKQYYEAARSAYRDITGAAPSKRETAILKDAGYRYVERGTKLERGWIDPSGRGITADQAARAVDQIKAGQVATADPGEEYRRAREREMRETRARERIAKREQKRPASIPDAKRPQGRVGRIIDAATAVLVGTGVLDVIKNPPLPDRPPPLPPDPGMGSPGEFDLPPKSPGPFVPPPYIPPVQAPAPPPPKAEPAAPWEPLLLPVPVYSSPVPVPGPLPAPPSPATAMPGGAPTASAPTPPTAPLWKQALPFVLPLALSALTVPRGGSKRRDPLTLPQTPTLGSLQPTLASYPLPFPGSGFGGSGASTSTDTCECKPKGPRKRRRKRTVCYSGTYTEKASGIRKLKKRKVPCR